MDIYDNDGNVVKKEETTAVYKDADAAETGDVKPSMGYILSQIEAIRADNAHIGQALEKVAAIQTFAPAMNASDLGSAAKAEAVGDIVKSRETTNQKALALLEKMYDDLRPLKRSIQEDAIDLVRAAMSNSSLTFEDRDLIIGALDSIRHISG